MFGNKNLIDAASSHAAWCARHNVMSHTGRNNSRPWHRATEAGYPSEMVSENIWQQHGRNKTTYGSRFLWRTDWEFGKAAVTTWMNSPGHCANLLNSKWTEIGVGVARRDTHTMLVQMFGEVLPKSYSHYHDWSFHTHRNRPKGGRHYNAVRRRQRPWRIGLFALLGLSSLLAILTIVV